MSLVNHLPKDVQDIALDQGWDDLSIGLVLLGALERSPEGKSLLLAQAQEVAEEENSATPDVG